MTQRRRVLLLHGPNLDLLGVRETSVYGTTTLGDLEEIVRRELGDKGELSTMQSNHEGEMVEAVHSARDRQDAIIINAGALTHYSWALHDALRTFPGPIIEVHLSNPPAREPFRHGSVVASAANGSISGFGPDGYALAVGALSAIWSRHHDG